MVLDVLRNSQERTFQLNAKTDEFLRIFGLSERVVRILQGFPQGQDIAVLPFAQWASGKQAEGLSFHEDPDGCPTADF